jgi:hypothetical protein
MGSWWEGSGSHHAVATEESLAENPTRSKMEKIGPGKLQVVAVHPGPCLDSFDVRAVPGPRENYITLTSRIQTRLSRQN